MDQILIVDDDGLIAKIYGQIFVREGFLVDIASDGETAIEIIHRKKPDVVLLDLMLPKMSGVEVIKIIRSQPTLQDLPVIVFTQYFSDILEQAMEAGASRIVVKGLDTPQEVVQVVRLALGTPVGSG